MSEPGVGPRLLFSANQLLDNILRPYVRQAFATNQLVPILNPTRLAIDFPTPELSLRPIYGRIPTSNEDGNL